MSFCLRVFRDRNYKRPEFIGKEKMRGSSVNCLWIKEDLIGQPIRHDEFDSASRIILGDLVEDSNFSSERLDSWLLRAKGNFQCLLINDEKIEIASSVFSILPIFYIQESTSTWISDRVETLCEIVQPDIQLSKEHLLERLLFNYTLTDRTWIEGIRQFPANSVYSIKEKSEEFRQYLNLFDLYQQSPNDLKESRNDLVNSFSTKIQKYFPNEVYASAFTGGFDGRCVVSAALKSGKTFESFSFGKEDISDVLIPQLISKKLQFSYTNIKLDDEYLKVNFKENAEGMVKESNGMSTISRAHYRFGAKLLSKRHKYLLSGNFGSELFRSAHLDGVLTSNVFYNWLKVGLPSTLKDFKDENPTFGFIKEEGLQEAYLQLNSDLVEKRRSIPRIPLNSQLYFLMWSETIRNYFGPELCMQQKYIIHRSPFLDFEFFKELQCTEYSGAYGNFRERNLAKRVKGQLFYAHFLKNNDKGLFGAMTGKGYRPSDILNPIGLIRVSFAKLIKPKNPADKDPLLANQGLSEYSKEWKESLSDWKNLFSDISTLDNRSLKTVISGSIYVKHLEAKSN